MKNSKLLTLLVLCTACESWGDEIDTSGGALTERDIRSEMTSLRLVVNAGVAAVCGASPEDIEQIDTPSSAAGECYGNWAVAYDSCEEQYLPARPDEAHAFLTCERALLLDALACCNARDRCDEEQLAACTDEVAARARQAECDALFAVFEADFEACTNG
jgi:hypothetical protein